VAAVERRQWRRRRPRVDDDGGDRQSAASTTTVATDRVESGRDLERFGMKSETTQDGLLFIDSKISATILV
jgi:hypothetical protein